MKGRCWRGKSFPLISQIPLYLLSLSKSRLDHHHHCRGHRHHHRHHHHRFTWSDINAQCYAMIRSGWSHYQTQLILIIDYKTISETRPSINWKQKRSAYFAQIPASLILDIFPCYFYHLVLMSLFFFFKYWHPCAGELPPWGNTLFIQAQCTDKTNCTAFETKGNTRKLTSV